MFGLCGGSRLSNGGSGRALGLTRPRFTGSCGYPLLRGSGKPVSCSSIDQRLAQNWHGLGESDCLIKTKHCDGQRVMLTQCDFCPVL